MAESLTLTSLSIFHVTSSQGRRKASPPTMTCTALCDAKDQPSSGPACAVSAWMNSTDSWLSSSPTHVAINLWVIGLCLTAWLAGWSDGVPPSQSVTDDQCTLEKLAGQRCRSLQCSDVLFATSSVTAAAAASDESSVTLSMCWMTVTTIYSLYNLHWVA